MSSMLPMKVEGGCPLASPYTTEQKPNAWIAASAEMMHWRQMYEISYTKALEFGFDENRAKDWGTVAANLDQLARFRRIKVIRRQTDSQMEHSVNILYEEDGELIPAEIGGHIQLRKLKCYVNDRWAFQKESIGNGFCRIILMIADIDTHVFPDIPLFQRNDGSRVDLGVNGGDHYYLFSIDMNEEDLQDQF